MLDEIEFEKPLLYCVIGEDCHPIAMALEWGGSVCNVYVMSSAALWLPFAPMQAFFPLVLTNDASLMLRGEAEDGNVSEDRGATWAKIKT